MNQRYKPKIKGTERINVTYLLITHTHYAYTDNFEFIFYIINNLKFAQYTKRNKYVFNTKTQKLSY